MRNIKPASLAKILQKQGTEPVNIVRIWWTRNGYIDYADRAFESVRGDLLSLSDLEDVINVDASSSSTSVSVTLNDTNNSLKTIFNNTDIHRKRVQILQWFTDIPLSEAFIIFEGEIASPVTWSEGDRTLSFEVLSKLEDREVGFSAEEARFNWVPPNIIGVPWPLVFGRVNAVPAIQVNDVPTGLTADSTGVVEEQSDLDQISELQATINQVLALANACFLQAVQCAALEQRFISDQQEANLFGGGEADYSSEIEYWRGQKESYLQKGNEYLAEHHNLTIELQQLQAEQQEKVDLRKNTIPVANANAFPQGASAFVKINGHLYQGYFDAGNFQVTQHPNPFNNNFTPAGLTTIEDSTIVTRHRTQLPPQRFIFLQGGSELRMGADYPVTYIAALNHVTVAGVQARRNGLLIGVPPNYYAVQHRTYGTLRATFIVFFLPLSSRNEGWEDEIYCNLISPIGPQASEILTWLVNTYTEYTINQASLNAAKVYIDRYPMNFALYDRPNILELLREIAFQARCAIWFNDNQFYLKFLPKSANAVETITEADIDLASIEVSYTSTEDVVTKFVAEWRRTGEQQNPNKVIFRNNINKYGTKEEVYDFFCYNNQAAVEKMAEFWTIRKSNVWKRISFRTFLHKLKIETWDTINLNLTNKAVANGNVKAIVESSKFDSSSWKLIITCWVPVRAGEMEEYRFAQPADLPVEFIYPRPDDPNVGSPNAPDAGGDLVDQSKIFGNQVSAFQSTRAYPDQGRKRPIGDAHDNLDNFQTSVALDTREVIPGTPPSFGPGLYRQYQVKPLEDPPFQQDEASNSVFFGYVDAHIEDNKYKVSAYINGPNLPPRSVTARQFSIRDDEIIPPGTPTIIIRQTFTTTSTALGGSGGTTTERLYAMQVPVWVKPQEEEDDGGTSPPPPDPGSPPPPPEPGVPFDDGGGDIDDDGGDFGGGGDF